MKLFVGLGNPGTKYARNRHNVGFMSVDAIAARHGFGPWKKKFQGLAADGDIAGERVLLLKPDTYVNDCGRAVGEAVRYLKLAIGDVVVIYDEIDLAPGKLKVKTGGGNAGHNGLRSISAHLDNDYERIRIGVGHPGHKDLVAHWVLNDFSKADQDWLAPMLDAIAGAAGRLAKGDSERFLTDVARALNPDRPDKPAAVEPSAPAIADTAEAMPRKPAKAPHPAGERMAKRESAIAANLKRWLASAKKSD